MSFLSSQIVVIPRAMATHKGRRYLKMMVASLPYWPFYGKLPDREALEGP